MYTTRDWSKNWEGKEGEEKILNLPLGRVATPAERGRWPKIFSPRTSNPCFDDDSPKDWCGFEVWKVRFWLRLKGKRRESYGRRREVATCCKSAKEEAENGV